MELVANPNYCAPEQLKSSTRLVAVQDAVQQVSNEEIKRWEGIHDTPQSMRDATNALLLGARIKNASIEDVNDIDHHLQVTPGDDVYFADLYGRSGYLTVWVAERDKNLWQYDLQAMLDEPGPDAEKRQYCENLLGDDDEGLVRFEVNRAGYSLLAEEYPLETFRRLRALYEKLVELHLSRRRTAAQWLCSQGSTDLPARNPALLLTPHTEEWFAALAAWNPQQAGQTRFILQQTGHDDVCSVCGDDPVETIA